MQTEDPFRPSPYRSTISSFAHGPYYKCTTLHNLKFVLKQNRPVKLNVLDSKVFYLKFISHKEGKKNFMASPLGVTSK